MPNKPTHGGQRDGAGRKPLEEPTEPKTVTLFTRQVKALKDVNLSELVRQLIDVHLTFREMPHVHRDALSAFIRYDDRNPDKLTIHINTGHPTHDLDSMDIPLHYLKSLKNDIDYIVESLAKKESE